MREKLQEFATNLDRKRLYTAVGALAVALAAGHFMQRQANEPNVVVNVDPADAPVQLAAAAGGPVIEGSITPDGTETPVIQVEAETEAPAPAVEMAATEAPTSVETPVDVAEATPMETPMAEPTTEEELMEMLAEVEIQNIDTTPEMQSSLSNLTISGLPEGVSVDLPELTAQAQIVAEEVTRALNDDTLMPAGAEPVVDIAPPAATAPEEVANCEVSMTADPMPGALIALDIVAPCAAGQSIDLNHDNLWFSEKLDASGMLSLTVPAMTEAARIETSIGGEVVTAQVTVPDMAAYDRVALIWQGGTGLQLHALENGAFYGEEGHIWAETPGTPARASKGEGGYLTVLGSTAKGYAADVYTYPTAMKTAPAVSIEAQVLESTCDSAISGQYLRSNTMGAPILTDVGMVLPGCEAVGEYLVLKNLPQDLTIARN